MTRVTNFVEDHRGDVPFSSRHVIVHTCDQHHLVLSMLTLITCLRWCLSDFSIVKLIVSSPFPDKGYSLEGGKHIQHALTEWGVKTLFPEGTELTWIIGHFSAQEICPLPPIYWFNHLFTSVWTQIIMLYFRLESNTTLCILWLKLFQLWPLGALSQLAPLFLKLIPITVWGLGFSYEFWFALSSISLLNRHYQMLLLRLVYFLFQP